MPNARKPRVLKIMQGTLRKDRDVPEPDYPVVEDTPDAPDWLINPEAVKEWRRITALLCPQRVLTEADLSVLGHLCNLHADCVTTWRANRSPDAATITQLRLLNVEFGLTPKSRSHAGAGTGGKEKNAFDDIDAPAKPARRAKAGA